MRFSTAYLSLSSRSKLETITYSSTIFSGACLDSSQIYTMKTIPEFGLLEWYGSWKEQISVMQAAMTQLNLTRWQIARFFLLQLWRDTPSFVKALLFFVSGVILLAKVEALVRPYFSTPRRLGIPQLSISRKPGDPFYYEEMMIEAGRKYPDQLFFYRIGPQKRVVIPAGYADEVKRLTDETASVLEFGRLATFDGWDLLGSKASSSTFHKVASAEFARSLPPIVPAAQDAVSREYDLAIDLSRAGWGRAPRLHLVNKLIVAVNQVAIVGEPLDSDRHWLLGVRFLPQGGLHCGVWLFLQLVLTEASASSLVLHRLHASQAAAPLPDVSRAAERPE